MKTFLAKKETLTQPKWYLIDAKDVVLGRLAVKAANIIRGRNKASYTPHVDTGDYVIIINAEKVVLTGKKLDQKLYRKHTGYPGGLKEINYRTMLQSKPELAMYEAIRRMMPKGPLGRQMLTKVRIYRGPEHKNAAQCPETLVLK